MTPQAGSSRLVLRTSAGIVVFAGLAAFAAKDALVHAQGGAEAFRVAVGDIRVTCPLTVGGSFEARSSALTGALMLRSRGPIAFDGELSADLSSLDTGIGLRNQHLRENYLEIQKGADYATATLSEIRLPEKNADAIGTAVLKTRFTAKLRLHGVTRDASGTADVRRTPQGARIDARFDVHLPAYGIPKPRYLGVGVKDDVSVRVWFDAASAPGV